MSKKIAVTSIVLFSLIIGIGVGWLMFAENQTAEEKAILLFYFDSWGPNENDSSEIIFSGWVYNFGLVEARDVVVNCSVTKDKKTVFSALYDAGNIGSESNKYVEIIKEYSSGNDEFASCQVQSCTDCLNLIERVHEE